MMKNRRHLGWIDLCLIGLLCLSLAGFGLRLWQELAKKAPSGETVEVILMVSSMPTEGVLCLSPGERVYFEDGGNFGVLVSYAPEGRTLLQVSGGEYIEGEDPVGRLCDLRLCVRVTGDVREGGLLLSGRRLFLIGERLTLATERVLLPARISGIGSDHGK